ncbi:M50 family metallopeptidase [Candidatus Nitrososphaera sp. FF02]|uniref:M50 family metallopeptidase n=1 Tax=Candidatus Nitrososphaera sp. FF02 TaxID=3398226 RepID=UPI0039E7A0F4
MEQQRKVRAEVKLPLILIHTPFGLDFFDRVAKLPGAKAWSKINTYFMPLITVLAVFLIVGSLAVLFSNAEARDAVEGVGLQGNLLIPGLNPYLPITYGWVALVITIIIHEAGHGIVARVYNIRVDSTGIVLFLGLPIGAFVNIERDELNKATLKQKSAVLTAGPLNNMILAGLSLVALYLVLSTLTVAPGIPQFGVAVVSVNPGSLAESIGLSSGAVIQEVAGQQTREVENLGEILRANLGQTIDIKWVEESGQAVTRLATLPEAVEPGRGVLGIQVTPLGEPGQVLDNYKSFFGTNPLAILLPPTLQPGVVPYSDLMAPTYESSIGQAWPIIANMLFWSWFINFNVGIFNALPIGPLDGGQLYGALIEKRVKSQVLARNVAMMLTAIMVAIVAASIFLPYVL